MYAYKTKSWRKNTPDSAFPRTLTCRWVYQKFRYTAKEISLKDKDYCPIEIIKGLTDKGQFQYLIKLMGPQEGTYLYATQFHSLR